jgi:hypothetical protein
MKPLGSALKAQPEASFHWRQRSGTNSFFLIVAGNSVKYTMNRQPQTPIPGSPVLNQPA